MRITKHLDFFRSLGGTLPFFLNQLLTGQHLAYSGEAQLKKSPCMKIDWQIQTCVMTDDAIIFLKSKHHLQGDRVSKRRRLFRGKQFDQGKQRNLRRRRWPALIVSITFALSKMIPDVKLHYFHHKHALHYKFSGVERHEFPKTDLVYLRFPPSFSCSRKHRVSIKKKMMC